MIPPEIREIIYSYWASYRLQKLGRQWGINQLDKVLRENEAIAWGISVLSCWTAQISPSNHLNMIIVNHQGTADINRLMSYTTLFPILFDPEIYIGGYFSLYNGYVLTVLIAKPTNMKDLLEKISDTDRVAIAYNGHEWYNPYISLTDMVETNNSRLIFPYKKNKYELEVSEKIDVISLGMKINRETLLPNHYQFVEKLIPWYIQNAFIKYINDTNELLLTTGLSKTKIYIDTISPKLYKNFKNIIDDFVTTTEDDYWKIFLSADPKIILGRRVQMRILIYITLGFVFSNLEDNITEGEK